MSAVDRKRALSKAQAQACEDATEPRCRCRCGGEKHGAKRGAIGTLPAEDPHKPDQADLFDDEGQGGEGL